MLFNHDSPPSTTRCSYSQSTQSLLSSRTPCTPLFHNQQHHVYHPNAFHHASEAFTWPSARTVLIARPGGEFKQHCGTLSSVVVVVTVVRSFARSLQSSKVPKFLPSFVRFQTSKVPSFVAKVPSFVRSLPKFLPSLPKFLRSFVRSFPKFLRSFVRSSERSFGAKKGASTRRRQWASILITMYSYLRIRNHSYYTPLRYLPFMILF